MRIIKYQLATEINRGTPEKPDIETVLSGVTMPYTETNYQLALSEAWQGKVTVEEVADTADEIRQALRDVPQQEHFPSAITWPRMPELANQP